MAKGKAKKSRKQSWKKISMQAVEEAEDKRRVQDKLDKAALDGDLFTVDAGPPPPGMRKKRDKVKHTEFGKKKEVKTVKKTPDLLKLPKTKLPRYKKDLPIVEEPTDDLWEGNVPMPQYLIHEERQRPKKRRPSALLKPESLAPAVILPKNGQAFNPDEDEHKQVMFEAAALEVEKYEQTKALISGMKPMTQRLLTKYSEEELAAMTPAEQTAKFQEMTGMAEAAQAPPADPADPRQFMPKDRFTAAQRNKTLRKKFIERLQKDKAKERQAEKQLRGIDTISGALKTDSKKFADRKRLKESRQKEKIEAAKRGERVQPKKISKYKFREVAVAVAVGSDVVGSSLRSARLDNTTTAEVVGSIFRRNMLEAPEPLDRDALQREKYRRFQHEKWNHMADPAMRVDKGEVGLPVQFGG